MLDLEKLVDFVLDGEAVAVPAEASFHVPSVLREVSANHILVF